MEDKQNRIEAAIKWYESLSDEDRVALQYQFGLMDVPDREIRFFEWIADKVPMVIETMDVSAAEIPSINMFYVRNDYLEEKLSVLRRNNIEAKVKDLKSGFSMVTYYGKELW